MRNNGMELTATKIFVLLMALGATLLIAAASL